MANILHQTSWEVKRQEWPHHTHHLPHPSLDLAGVSRPPPWIISGKSASGVFTPLWAAQASTFKVDEVDI